MNNQLFPSSGLWSKKSEGILHVLKITSTHDCMTTQHNTVTTQTIREFGQKYRLELQLALKDNLTSSKVTFKKE